MRTVLISLLLILTSCVMVAQDKAVARKPFPLSLIVVEAPNLDDSTFVAAAVREELIRAGKAIIVVGKGDTLLVRLTIQFKKSSNGRDGKWGEVSIAIVSKNGRAAATARNYVGAYYGSFYYQTLQKLAEEAAKRFVYLE